MNVWHRFVHVLRCPLQASWAQKLQMPAQQTSNGTAANSAKNSQMNGCSKGVDPVVGNLAPVGAWAKGVPSTDGSTAPHLQRQSGKNSHHSRNGQNGLRSGNGRQPAGSHGPCDGTGSSSTSNAGPGRSSHSNTDSTRSAASNANSFAQAKSGATHGLAKGALRRDSPGQASLKARPQYGRQGSGLAAAKPQAVAAASRKLSAGVPSEQVRQEHEWIPFGPLWAAPGIHMLWRSLQANT